MGSVAFFTPQKARTISGIFPANWGMDYATYTSTTFDPGNQKTSIEMTIQLEKHAFLRAGFTAVRGSCPT